MASAKLPNTMKAWQFTSTSPTLEKNLKLNPNAPLPIAANAPVPSDKILVQVHAVSINPVDYKFPEIPLLGRLITGSPATPSIDFAGRVAALGPTTSSSSSAKEDDLKVGQLVWGRLNVPTKHGTMAEYTLGPRTGTVALPEGVSLVDAVCATSVGLTAYQSLVPKLRRIQAAGVPRPRVFINGGSGGCGTYGIQIAKAMGGEVTVSCSGGNVELCRSLGADEVIDYRSQDLLAELEKSATSSPASGPFDLVVDNVGLPADLYWQAPRFTKAGAPYVQVGSPGGVTLGFVRDMLVKTLWPKWGGRRPWEFMSLQSRNKDMRQIGTWMREGKVRSVVDEVFDFEDKGPVRAYEKLRKGRTRGKIVVKVVEDESAK